MKKRRQKIKIIIKDKEIPCRSNFRGGGFARADKTSNIKPVSAWGIAIQILAPDVAFKSDGPINSRLFQRGHSW